MSKHTPGPWVIQFGGMEGDEYFTICHLAHREHRGVVTEYTPVSPRPSVEIQANARLIAAAPDLLEAARMALECLTFGDATMWEDPESPYHFLGSAIARATGEVLR